MPSTYTTNLGIELPADGELDGVWGDVVNENMDILDRAINGSVTLTLSGTTSTLTTSDGVLSNGQYKLLVLGGTPSGTHTITIAPNDAQKIYFVYNTTAQSVVFTQGSGGNVTIATGDSGVIYSNGGGASAAVVNITDHFAMSSVKITGGSITGITDLAVADGGTGASDAGTARTNLGLAIGTNVQAYDADLAAIAALAVTDSNFIVGNGTTWVAESGATARASLGLGTMATQNAGTVAITGGSIAGITDLAVADGGTGASTAAQALLNLGLTATAAELNILDGVTATTAELNILDGVTATTAELNILDGVTATTAELNFVDGVTSAIQTQLDNKQPLDADLTAIAALAVTDSNFIVGNGTTWVAESGATARTSLGLGSIATQNSNSVSITGGSIAGITDLAVADGGTGASDAGTARTNLGLAIGTDVQAYNAQLADIAALSVADSNFIVGNGTTWVAETGATVRTSLGLGTMATQNAASVAITGGSISGITDLAVADGGTGASDAATARTNLGLVIGSNVQAYDAGLQSIAGLTTAADRMIYTTAADTYAVTTLTAAGRAILDDASAADQRTTLGLVIGSNVQAYDADLAAIAALAVTDGNFIVGNGTTWVVESGATARTSLGLGTLATQSGTFSDAVIGPASATDNAVVRFNATTGKLVQDSAVTIADTGVMTVVATNSGTNTVLDALRVDRQSSGTPAAGIGVGVEFAVGTAAGNTEVGAVIEAVTTDVTAASEDFNLVFRTMAAGAAAAERLRITSIGQLGIAGANYGTAGQVLTSGGAAAAPSWDDVADVQTFTSSGTWTKPDGATTVLVRIWGGGGGGEGGPLAASSTTKSGGDGGGGGAYEEKFFSAADLTSTVSVTIGAGGTAGAAIASTAGSGGNGGAGGSTTFGAYLAALGGNGGASGVNSSDGADARGAAGGAGGSLDGDWSSFGGGGGAGGGITTGTQGGNSGYSGGGGGGGGGESSGNVLGPAGPGGASAQSSGNGSGAAAGTSNASAPTGGANGTTFGMGGGGGGSATTAANAGKGGNGGIGGGGGGGGSNRSGSASRFSGAGGTGGNGWAQVISW